MKSWSCTGGQVWLPEMMKRNWHHHGPTNNPVCRGGHESAMRAPRAPLALSKRKDLSPQGMAFAVIPPRCCVMAGLLSTRSAASEPAGHTQKGHSKQGTHYQHERAYGNSMRLKNKPLEACLETGMDAVEAQRQHLLLHVPLAGTNKGKWAGGTKLQLLLSSFYSHLNVPRVSVFRRWFTDTISPWHWALTYI